MVSAEKTDFCSQGPKAGVDDIYCSAWCGFGCTKTAHDRAQAEAKFLCNRLGDGWQPHVWENCGWHFEARKASLRVHAQTQGSKLKGTYIISGYTAEIRAPYQIWPHEVVHSDPQSAVDYTLDLVRAQIEAATKALEAATT